MSIISKAWVISVKDYDNSVREYKLKLEKNYPYSSGGFLLLSLDNKFNEFRNFSICNAYNKERIIKLIIKNVGYYTNKLFSELSLGKEVLVKYDLGDFLLPFFDRTNPIITISSGTGIAPILSFCEDLKQKGEENRLYVFHSFKNTKLMVGIDSLIENTKKENLFLYSTREALPFAKNRRIDIQDILNLNLDLTKAHIYICGGEEFTKTFKTQLQNHKAQNIYTEEWD